MIRMLKYERELKNAFKHTSKVYTINFGGLLFENY